MYGKVVQSFTNKDGSEYVNIVKVGPIAIHILARKSIETDITNMVQFYQIKIVLGNNRTILKRKVNFSSNGKWKYLFLGTIQDKDGRMKSIRVMETPKLFILERILSE